MAQDKFKTEQSRDLSTKKTDKDIEIMKLEEKTYKAKMLYHVFAILSAAVMIVVKSIELLGK